MSSGMSRYKFALVFGGGFSKGAYQFGFAKALFSFISAENLAIFSCASAGALNGYAFSAGKAEEAERMWREFSCSGILEFIGKSWRGDILTSIADELVRPGDRLSVPMTVPLCKIPALEALYVGLEGEYSDEWRRIMRAAIAFPVVSKRPVRVYKKRYIDGGFLDNVPVSSVMKSDADIVVVLHCDPKYLPVPGIYEYGKAVVDIDVTTEDVTLGTSFEMRGEDLNRMLDAGYEHGMRVGKRLFGSLETDSLHDIKRRIGEYLIEDYDRRRKKPVLDTIATMLNKLYSSLFLEN